jgi:hypothetical protein
MQGSQTACIVRLNYPKEHDDVLALRRPPRGRVIVEVVLLPFRALMHVLDSELEVGSSPGDGPHLYGLTGFHTINPIIVCSFICNRNLACSEGIRLD